MTFFNCRVIGIPQPQGSSRGFNVGGRVVITSDNPKNKSWRDTMSNSFVEASKSLTRPIFSTPVFIVAEFIMPRTKSLPKKNKPHTVKPDLDKLLRSLGDSLSDSRIINDDSIIVRWHASKRYAAIDECPGLKVQVTEV